MSNFPYCPRCKTNANMTEFGTFFRCAYCETKVMKEDNSQSKLKHWVR